MKKTVASIIVTGCLILSLSGCSSGSPGLTEPATTDPTVCTEPATEATEPIFQAASLDELFADLQTNISDTDAGSSSRVDAIAIYAKAAAKTGNETIGNEAVLYIVNNYPNYYDSNETMEKTMLCGYYLEYLDYGDRVTQLGEDAEQAVKYVYRGIESTDDDSTKENLDQLWEIIETSGFN